MDGDSSDTTDADNNYYFLNLLSISVQFLD